MKKKLDVVGKEFLQAVYSEGKSTVHDAVSNLSPVTLIS